MVTRAQLLKALPPFQDKYIVIAEEQEVKRDIIPEMVDGYKAFERFYDKIGKFFESGTLEETCEKLYAFCKENIAYREETVDWQTSALPTAILEWGEGDCKAYASFIGGCLGAISRATDTFIDWQFCFASYKRWKRTPYHVFVVVNTPEGLLWVDPTPGAADMEPRHTIYARPYDEYIAGVDEGGELVYTIGTTTTPAPVLDPQRVALLNSVSPGLGTSVASAMASLPEGNVKRFLRDMYSAGPTPWAGIQAVIKFLQGRTYTSGDYWNGETFMRNILGRSDIQGRNQVPDSMVPISWEFMSAAYGVRMRTEGDFEALSRSTEEYLTREPTETAGITSEQAERARRILLGPANPWNNRNIKWDLSWFNAEPYIYPVPGGAPGTGFTGTHPVLGIPFVDGYPVEDTATDEYGLPVNLQGWKTFLINNKKYIAIGGLLILAWWLTDE